MMMCYNYSEILHFNDLLVASIQFWNGDSCITILQSA